jgi:hypothetical protein
MAIVLDPIFDGKGYGIGADGKYFAELPLLVRDDH